MKSIPSSSTNACTVFDLLAGTRILMFACESALVFSAVSRIFRSCGACVTVVTPTALHLVIARWRVRECREPSRQEPIPWISVVLGPSWFPCRSKPGIPVWIAWFHGYALQFFSFQVSPLYSPVHESTCRKVSEKSFDVSTLCRVLRGYPRPAELEYCRQRLDFAW